MKYKEYIQAISSIILNPKNKWIQLTSENTTSEKDDLKLIYNLIGINIIVNLIGGFIYQNHTQAISIIIYSLINGVSLFGGFWLTFYIFTEFLSKKFELNITKEKAIKYISYACVLHITTSTIIALIPSLFFLQIINIYGLYIIWEGATIITDISENRKSNFSLLFTICILLMPFIIYKLLLLTFPIANI